MTPTIRKKRLIVKFLYEDRETMWTLDSDATVQTDADGKIHVHENGRTLKIPERNVLYYEVKDIEIVSGTKFSSGRSEPELL